ncbi:hypothetical protein [Pseudomonas costantinii]|uniref:Uncharacterized protein n=1 Tax=Pseudomonas costantinii TaxID=168469 RepID=A0A1H4U015_9PSED|nr:hypothetical protein [Pseudomonas costantinii]SEC62076.1 hypothetical protein SAMN04515675_0009 [Pseudomonas costantinii]SEC63785.1 hypothetical protein SAMN04515675_0064 [Pseudomonas costantinii]
MTTPDLILPTVQREGDELVIRIHKRTLAHSVAMGDNWPVSGDGQPMAFVIDQDLLMVEIAAQLLEEDEQGATPLHHLFDNAAMTIIENGGESIELREDEEGDE